MNLKHEMFWNKLGGLYMQLKVLWTLNMKCFEIIKIEKTLAESQ